MPSEAARPRPAARSRAAAGLLALLTTLALPLSADAKTLVGTPDRDHLSGTSPGGDLLYGGGGSDVLVGGPGPDVIYGVRAGNLIRAGAGNNYVEGGTGPDRITAGDGRNTVYGGTGDDHITLGDGDNYVDPGGARDDVQLGDGDNVVNAGRGGLILRAGDGNNVVYYHSGPDQIVLGKGVNKVYVATVGQLAQIDCGGNPGSTLYVSRSADPDLAQTTSTQLEGKIRGCPRVELFDAPALPPKQVADPNRSFSLIGTDASDTLYGGSAGGFIDGKAGDNELWADRETAAGPGNNTTVTTILAADGDNTVYGGRGSNIIRLGNGDNFVRGGPRRNSIRVGTGSNVVRLRGKGRNTVTAAGGRLYVESFVLGKKRPRIRCRGAAVGVIVYGVRRPRTNCGTVVRASSKRGKRFQVQGVEHIRDSDRVVVDPIVPGQGAGVPRPR